MDDCICQISTLYMYMYMYVTMNKMAFLIQKADELKTHSLYSTTI